MIDVDAMRELHFYIVQRFEQMKEQKQQDMLPRMEELNLLFNHFLQGMAADQMRTQQQLHEVMNRVKENWIIGEQRGNH